MSPEHRKRSGAVYIETPTETSFRGISKGSHPQCNILMEEVKDLCAGMCVRHRNNNNIHLSNKLNAKYVLNALIEVINLFISKNLELHRIKLIAWSSLR